jgi:hypothetical protein
MRELDRVLRDLAETGRVGGAERLIERLQRRLAGEAAPVVGLGRFDMEKPKARLTGRKGLLIAAAALVVALAVALPLWLLGGGGEEAAFVDGSSTAPSTTGAVTTTGSSGMATGDTMAVSEMPWDLPVPRFGEPLLALSADEAWLYAEEHLLHLDAGQTSYLPLPPSVTWIMGLAMAPDGTLWVGTNAGVLSYDGRAWTQRLLAEGAAGVRALAVAEDGMIWVGGVGDAGPLAESYWLARWDGEAFVRVDPNPGVPPGTGFSVMAAAADGAVWMASTGWVQTDLLRYDAGAIEAVQIGDYEDRSPDSPSGPVGVFAIETAPDGDVWVGGFDNGDWDRVVLSRYDGAAWTTYDWPFADRSGSGDVLFFGLAVAPDGTVWVDFPGGLGSCDGNTWSIRMVTMAETGTSTTLDVAPDGTVWYFDQAGLHTFSAP